MAWGSGWGKGPWGGCAPGEDITPPVVSLLALSASPITGSMASTLGGLSSAASGVIAITGTGASSLPGLACSGTGSVAIAGTGASTLGGIASSGTGSVAITGAAASTLGGLECTATGTVASGSFDPLDTGPKAAWRADVVVTSPTFSLPDRTGNGYDATPVGGSPSVNAGPPAYLGFSGQALTQSVSAASGAQSIYFVFQLTTTSISFAGLYSTSDGTASTLLYLINPTLGYTGISLMCGDTVGGLGVGIVWTPDTALHSFLCVWDGTDPTNPAAYTIYLDGIEQTVVASGTFGGAGSYNAIASDGGGSPAPIDFYELIVWSTNISGTVQSEMVGAGSYSATRYGV